jgi:hypothetical protein
LHRLQRGGGGCDGFDLGAEALEELAQRVA